MSLVKQASREARQEHANLTANKPSLITLNSGKQVNVGYIIGETQDKLDSIILDYENQKQFLKPINPEEVEKGGKPRYDLKILNRLNKVTRQFYAQMIAAILINSYWGLKLRWNYTWRKFYRQGTFTGEDYLAIAHEAKKKAQEQYYSMAMVFLMDMTTTWTTMTKKEAEEYHQELELEREAQLLKNSQN